jgi:hypothetical protein
MEEKETANETVCRCPYCDAEIKLISGTCAICEPCSITIITCTSCGESFREGPEECPQCGEPLGD